MNNFNPDVILKIILDKNFQSSGDDPVVCTKRVSGRSCLFKFFSPDNTCKYIKIFASSNNEPLIYRLLKDHPLYIDVIHSVGTIEDVHYVILNDISTKATNLTSWKNPVDDGKMKKILSAVAEFHSLLYNRNDNLLSAIGKPWHLQSEMNYLRHLEHLKRDFEKFIADMPLPVDTTVQSFFTESLEYLNFNRMRIFDDSRNKLLFTFIHGDLNAGNIYYPKGLISSVQILDLEAVRLGLVTEDLIMLLVNDFYHDYQTLIRQIRFYQSQLHAELKDILTEERLSSFLAVTLRENLFFPMKLYAHDRIKDKELLNNVIRAYQDFAKNKTA